MPGQSSRVVHGRRQKPSKHTSPVSHSPLVFVPDGLVHVPSGRPASGGGGGVLASWSIAASSFGPASIGGPESGGGPASGCGGPGQKFGEGTSLRGPKSARVAEMEVAGGRRSKTTAVAHWSDWLVRIFAKPLSKVGERE